MSSTTPQKPVNTQTTAPADTGPSTNNRRSPVKRVAITLILECRDDIPAHVVRWMAGNLADHAHGEFNMDYEPSWNRPSYDGPPLAGRVHTIVGEVVTV